jgi:PAS domain S-box-containing protein
MKTEPTQKRERRILIVEDENIVAVDIKDRLEYLGYTVSEHATAGQEAIMKAGETSPDLVLMDIMLKGDMDGVEAAEQIRLNFDIPVVYLTAYADVKTLERAKITEPYGYILKPFEEREMRTTIEMALYRHEMGRKLKESQQWLATILKSIGDGVVATDVGGSVAFMNSVAESLTGWKEEEALGRSLDEVFDIEESASRRPVKDLASSLLGGISGMDKGDYVITSRGGRKFSVEFGVSHIRDDMGGVTGVVMVFRDVTERRRAEAELLESEMKFRSVFQSASDAIILSDANGSIIAWNSGAEGMFGYSQGEVLGKPISILVPPPLLEFHERGFKKIVGGGSSRILGETVEFNGVRKDGTEFPIELSLATWKSGGEMFFSGIIRDISERKRAEEKLENTLSEMNIILENATVGIIFLKGGNILWVNRNFEEMFGFSRRELDGKEFVRFYHSREDYDRVEKEAYHVLRAGMTCRNEVMMKNRAGSTFWCSLVGKAVDPSDLSRGTIWIIDDISERKRAEEQMQAAKEAAEAASRTKSMFLANMSHEIRTPMNSILGMTELVLDTGLSDEQLEYINTVRDSAYSLLSLLNDVLDFSKIEAGRLELESVGFNLRDAVHVTIETISAQAQRKGLSLGYEISPNVCTDLMGDPGRLRQVMVNLLDNAIKFTSEGEVVFRVGNFPDDRSGPSRDGKVKLLFSVSDTGIGVPMDKLDTIFESFTQADGSTTRNYGGSGLGLSISRQIVQIMGGEIWVESEPGKGSTFYFTVAFECGDSPGFLAPGEGMDFRGMDALIVDGKRAGRRSLREMAASLGFRVQEAARAAEALRLIEGNADGFHMLLVDCMLSGMDVFEFVEKIKTLPQVENTRIIMLSSAGFRGDMGRCKELGVAGYLRRPVSRDELIKAIANTFRETMGRGAVVTRHSLRESGRGLRVLVAEDNLINQKLALSILKKAGHSVTVVMNGKEALETLGSGSYEVVLMDVQMPVMDGLEATKAIRNSWVPGVNRDVPVIALTAHAMRGDRERFIQAGMDGYVSKPFRSAELLEAIRRCVSDPACRACREESRGRKDFPGDVINAGEALRLLDGDRELLVEIWETFVQGSSAQVEKIERALASADFKTLEVEAHSLKSASGSVGAMRLKDEAFSMEQAAAAKDKEAVSKVFKVLKQEYGKAIGEMQRLLNDKPSS